MCKTCYSCIQYVVLMFSLHFIKGIDQDLSKIFYASTKRCTFEIRAKPHVFAIILVFYLTRPPFITRKLENLGCHCDTMVISQLFSIWSDTSVKKIDFNRKIARFDNHLLAGLGMSTGPWPPLSS